MSSNLAAGEKLWGGRFTEAVDIHMDKLNSSIAIDKQMYAEDIQGSVAYARALVRATLLSKDEGNLIINGLKQIKVEWDERRFVLCSTDEDIHTAIERRLTEMIGITIGGKLHTGRSRNDQTITDTKLWLRKAIDEMSKTLIRLIQVLVVRADDEKMILMPGYTHLQRAQPVRWSQWLLGHAWNFKNDYTRLVQIRERVNVMPLGSGALAGNPFGIDRIKLAEELEFSGVTDNSMQAVGDRDFVAEYLFWTSLISLHLSRLAEDLVLYSCQEFSFVKFSDGFSTGSSLMPQKRNPDCVELIRGKTGTILGKFVGFMVTLKGIPSSYNKDLQEDKEALFMTHETLLDMLIVTEGAIRTLQINEDKCKAALEHNMLATDVAYYLVRKGISFREAHHAAGKVVAYAESKKISLQDITLNEFKSIRSFSNHKFKEIVNLHDCAMPGKRCTMCRMIHVQCDFILNNCEKKDKSKLQNFIIPTPKLLPNFYTFMTLFEHKPLEIGKLDQLSRTRAFGEDIENIWNFEKSVEQYSSIGGTSLSSVQKQIDDLRCWITLICNILKQ